MAHYQQSLNFLFKSWNKAYELSSKIIKGQTRRNSLKKLQGNYRRFQKQVQINYGLNEQITIGLLRYYQVQAEKQYRTILQLNHPLTKVQSFKQINPWPKRMQDFQKNRKNKAKIDISDFIQDITREEK